VENHYPSKEVGQAFQLDLQCLSFVRGHGVINEAGCWDYLVGMTLGAIHVSQVPESGWPRPLPREWVASCAALDPDLDPDPDPDPDPPVLLLSFAQGSGHWRPSTFPRYQRVGGPVRSPHRLAATCQPTANGSRSGGVAVLRQSRSALRRSQLGHRHGRAIGAGMDDSASWETEETSIRLAKVTCIIQIWWLSPSPRRFGGCHLHLVYPLSFNEKPLGRFHDPAPPIPRTRCLCLCWCERRKCRCAMTGSEMAEMRACSLTDRGNEKSHPRKGVALASMGMVMGGLHAVGFRLRQA